MPTRPLVHAVRHDVARRSARMVAGVVLALVVTSAATGAQAAPRNVDFAPATMTSSAGSTGAGQSVAALRVADQSGAADDWGRYVRFTPRPGQAYLGEQSFTVPTVYRQRAKTLSLVLNVRAPRKADQAWTWSAYDWTSASWVAAGDNTAVTGGRNWTTLTLPLGRPSQVVSATGAVRVQLTSDSANGVLDLDAETLRISTKQGEFPAPPTPSPSPPSSVAPPPASGQFDYQLNQAYTPPAGVRVLARDRTARPVAGLYNICYVNALQTQPEEFSWWQATHPDLLLKRSGSYVFDAEWGEVLLDVSTDAKRRALLQVEKAWVDECAAKGFRAVEPDGQDSYARSQGLLTFAHDKEFMKLFTAYAHSKGLAVAQKNAGVEYGSTGRTDVGFDFAVAEECEYWNECRYYTDVYGRNVIEVEYADQPLSAFTRACSLRGTQHTILRRDRHLVAPGQTGYTYTLCP